MPADFPTCTVPDECVRAHSPAVDPYWFATTEALDSAAGGRFDLVDPPAGGPVDGGRVDGTLYCANDVEAAVRERLGSGFAGRRFIAASELNDTTVSVLAMRRGGLGRRVADTLSASGFLTREISTMPTYVVTRAWAREFHRHDFDGIAYEPRSTPGTHRVAYAVFGPAGARSDLEWAPHPGWWQDMIDTGVVISRIWSTDAEIIDQR